MSIDFPAFADECIARVAAATISPATEVNVVYHCVDADGNELPPFRMEVAPLTRVSVPGDPELARRWAAKDHLNTIIGNINSLIRPSTQDCFYVPREAPKTPLILKRVELEIVDA